MCRRRSQTGTGRREGIAVKAEVRIPPIDINDKLCGSECRYKTNYARHAECYLFLRKDRWIFPKWLTKTESGSFIRCDECLAAVKAAKGDKG